MSNNILFYCPCSGTKHYYDASALGTVSVYELGNGTRKTMANGVNGSYLRMPSNAINFLFENTMPTTLTIEWWQRNVGSYGCVIMPSNLLDGQKLQTQVRASVAQFQSIYFENRNGNLGDITLNNISNKEWTHIAYTQDYVNSRVYCHINGIYHGSAQTNNNQYAWKLLCIGAKSSNPESASEYFSGEIDEVIITAGVKYPHEQDFTPSTQLPSITDLAEGGDDETPEVHEYISNITIEGQNYLLKAKAIDEDVLRTIQASFPLFHHTWSDHLFNNTSWLRADTFSWQSGAVYTSAYMHLVADMNGVSAQTETISGTTITFYRATDGHKIVLADQASNVEAIYAATGVAWYYILDTANRQFKLPRTSWLIQGIGNGSAGDYVEAGLPDHTHSPLYVGGSNRDVGDPGAYVLTAGSEYNGVSQNANSYTGGVADKTVYSKSSTVQPRTTRMYLYFYVANTVQNQTSVDIGRVTEVLNGKVDVADLRACYTVIDTYVNGASGYRVWSDGYCEQWGRYTPTSNPSYITFAKTWNSTNYNLQLSMQDTSPTDFALTVASWNALTTTTAQIYQGYNGSSQTMPVMWRASGYINLGQN